MSNTYNPDPEEQELIRQEIQDLFAYAMDFWGIPEIADVTQELTPEQREWAKKHLDWQIVIKE